MVKTNQTANILSRTLANSNTGFNSIFGGNASVKTGSAVLIANSFSLANFVSVGGGFLFGVVNILGSWFGNLVVAYPDLEVSLPDNLDFAKPVDTQDYLLRLTNNGKARKQNIHLEFNYPSDTTSFLQKTTWEIDKLEPSETRVYSLKGQIQTTALANSSLVASAYATTQEQEISNENNSASDETFVLPLENEVKELDHRLPNLETSVWNNVNDFVYPGDSVIARINNC